MYKRIATNIIIALILILLPIITVVPVFSGTTGKITGMVTDKESGEPLPGVNVVVDDTKMGAATDISGRYFLLNVPPGRYTLTATMIGYQAMRQENVIVKIDRTIETNFVMSQTVLDLGEIVTVVANRELVRKDVSFSQTNINTNTIEAIPAAYKIDKSLITQAGIKDDGQGILIRRGNYQEISYYLDGMLLKNQRTGRNESRMSTTSIEQVEILAGGFNAEYGNARSGVVNVVTKKPGKKYFFKHEIFCCFRNSHAYKVARIDNCIMI